MSKLQAAVWTVVLTFASAFIGLMLTNGVSPLEMHSWADWKPYVAAGIAALIALAARYLYSHDAAFGVVSDSLK